MKTALALLFGTIFVWMTAIVVRTSMIVSIPDAWASFAANPWAVATLYDAYFGFVIFWVWVAHRERTYPMRILWLVLILGLGNIATSLYVLIQLVGLRAGEPAESLLLPGRLRR